MSLRGIRNNNPGNIDRNATKWQGMSDKQTDPRFINFKTPAFGIRAMAIVLLTYDHKYGINTIRKAVNRWAPPKENDTDAYIDAVAKEAGVGPDDVVDFDDANVMRVTVKAIIHHENGEQPYSDAVLEEGLLAAGIAGAKPKPLVKQASFVTKAAGGVAVACGAAGQYAPVVKDWAHQLADYTGSPVFAHLVEVLTTVGGILVVASLVASVLKQRKAA